MCRTVLIIAIYMFALVCHERSRTLEFALPVILIASHSFLKRIYMYLFKVTRSQMTKYIHAMHKE